MLPWEYTQCSTLQDVSCSATLQCDISVQHCAVCCATEHKCVCINALHTDNQTKGISIPGISNPSVSSYIVDRSKHLMRRVSRSDGTLLGHVMHELLLHVDAELSWITCLWMLVVFVVSIVKFLLEIGKRFYWHSFVCIIVFLVCVTIIVYRLFFWFLFYYQNKVEYNI